MTAVEILELFVLYFGGLCVVTLWLVIKENE